MVVVAVATPPVRLRELIEIGGETILRPASEVPLVYRGSCRERSQACSPAGIARFIDVSVEPAGGQTCSRVAHDNAARSEIDPSKDVGIGGQRSRAAPLLTDAVE